MVSLKEKDIVEKVINYLKHKKDGNWHSDKIKKSNLHGHGSDIMLVGGSTNGERFIIECKGKSEAKSSKTINKECWINALGQIITRMDVKRYVMKNGNYSINRAYKYGLGLYWKSAQVALKRIPKNIAQVLNLYIFSVNDNGIVKQFTPSQFGRKEYPDELFK